MNVPFATAIVGIGCRFPGGVVDARGFWQLLCDGRDAIGDVPANRIDLDRFFDPRPATPGRMVSRRGGFLDAIEQFDAAFFGISPREAERLDPQQRLLLETAWEALEDAGADASRLEGSPTGVFVGQWVSDFESRLFADPDKIDFLMTTGSGRYAASGRLSYALGLRGPSLTIDTACSSSLVAVHLATRALRNGDCSLALAGGVNLILQPHITVAYSQSGMMAPDGRCKFGDASGDGYVRSEGAGIVVLKRLADAIADGDRIYAVIRGSAVNNDGQSSGMLGRPSRTGHEEVLRKAYADAGVNPAEVHYVEAHGTGTRAGDPVEIAALGAVLGEGRVAGNDCLLGSVKTNIGHTESAAGVAGLIKATLALHHGAIPASLHFVEPNPLVPWRDLPFRVSTQLQAWPSGAAPHMAGVNSFGISGTNAHVVLEAGPEATSAAAHPIVPSRPALLVLSARSSQALRALAQRHVALLNGASRSTVDDICWAAATRRTALDHRVAFVADDAAALVEQLAAYAAGEMAAIEGIAGDATSAAPVFVVPGQGGQWIGMARELLRREPAFRAALLACDAAARPHLDVSIVEQLALDAHAPGYRLDRIEVIQPTLVALAIGYGQWLRSLGIAPRALVGHSMGEVGAAHLAGVLDLDQAMRIMCRRSALMSRTSGQGGMLTLGVPMREAERRLAGRAHLLAVAASNGPASCVVAGDTSALTALMAEVEGEGLFCRLINVDVASHSPHMDAPAAALTAELAGLAPHAATVPILSTTLGRAAHGSEFDAAHWGRNLRATVQFDAVVQQLLRDGARCFVELGPHAVLTGAVKQNAQAQSADVVSLACAARNEPEHAAAMTVVARLWAAGLPIDWHYVLPRGHAHVDLPLYPWQRERHWCVAALQSAGRVMAASSEGGQRPLLGRRFDPAGQDVACWETTLAQPRFVFLADHVVRGSVIFPAAAYMEAALAAAVESRPATPWHLRDLEFLSTWALPPSSPARLQVRVHWLSPMSGRFEVHGLVSLDGAERWERCAAGRLVAAPAIAPLTVPVSDAATMLSHAQVYARLADAGLTYGPAFRGLHDVRIDGPCVRATIRLDPATIDPAATRYTAYPPLLDTVLQAFAVAALHVSRASITPLPTRVGSLELDAPWPLNATLTVMLRTDSGDAIVVDDTGKRLGALRGVVFTHLRNDHRAPLDDLLSQPSWVSTSLPTSSVPVGPVVVVAAAASTAQPLLDRLRSHGMTASWLPARDLSEPLAAERLRQELRTTADARAHLVLVSALECPVAQTGLQWIEDSWRRIGDDTLALARALECLAEVPAPRVWIVTQGAVAVDAHDEVHALGAAALWGLGRVWAHEQPALDLTLVDCDVGGLTTLPMVLRSAPQERQLARRAGVWHALRLLPLAADARPAALTAGLTFEAVLATPGHPDSLQWQAATRCAPRPHEVEIAVEHTALNFMNLMSTLGIYPGHDHGQGPLGIEASGRVQRVGTAVDHLRPGDAVVAVGPRLLQGHATVDARLVAVRPPQLDAAVAAGLPIAFLTALHALLQLARLEPGERVLIHSAAGGVGLAALQVARRVGAEVLATAGTDDKRALLRTMGVLHVFDSRHAGFADDVLAATGGRGVDVVLNSLAGDLLVAGLRCMAPYGRFVELGKRDIHGGTAIDLTPFKANQSFFAVDLEAMMRERPAMLGRLLRELMQDVAAGSYSALPTASYAADQVVAAFRDLMPGTHVGKHVVTLQPPPTQIHPTAGLCADVRADGCYVITGGLGALGLEVARWLASRGAGALMLIGRRAPSAATLSALQAIEASGTRVLTAACDVADANALAAALSRAREAAPLRGVFHAAGVLADATLGAMNADILRAPRDAKVMGAWHLDQLTQGDSLDAFVMFSSVASLFGTPGQGNYAAANAFLDALAHHRRARGHHALALNLGPVASVGLAADSARAGDALRRIGFDAMPAARVVEAIDRLFGTAVTQATCAAFDAGRWHAVLGRDGAVSLVPYADGAVPSIVGDARVSLRDALATAPAGLPRRARMESAIKDAIGTVLRMVPARVPTHRALRTLGMDSLMALELRNRLEHATGIALSPTLAWNHPTVHALADHLAQRLQLPLDAPEPDDAVTVAAAPDLEALLQDVEHMSDDEAQGHLRREAGA